MPPTTDLLLIACCMVIMSDVTAAQDIIPLIMCEDATVTVSTGSSGVIEHTQREEAPSSCSLIMTATSGSNISIPEIGRLSNDGTTCVMVHIDKVKYCKKKTEETEPGIIQQFNSAKTSINITITSDMSDFTLEYFNTVAVCGEDISIPDGAEVDRLSGIISSSITPSINQLKVACATTITNLPIGPVRFEIIHKDLGSGNKITIDAQYVTQTNPTTSFLVNAGSREISISFIPGDGGISGEVESSSFLIKFTVLTCGDVPQVDTTTSSTSTATPWFPGSKVNYTCNDHNYQLKNVSTADCEVVNMKAKWVNQSEIKCIPVPFCVKEPNNIANADLHRSDNHTATYQCTKGYEDETALSVTSTCGTDDADKTPWTWSSVSFTCTPVECKVNDLSLNTTTTNITSTGAINGSYYYEDVLTYECTFGYKKVDQKKVIQCLSNKTWSDTPDCTKMAECILNSVMLNISNGDTDTERYYLGDTLKYECDDGYKRSIENVQCQDTGNWSHTPGCVVDADGGDGGIGGDGGDGGGGVTDKMTNKKKTDFPTAAIAGGAGALVAVIIAVVITARCVRNRPQDSSSKTELNGEIVAEVGIENPYHELETTSDVNRGHIPTGNSSDGAYDMVNLESNYAEVGRPANAKPPIAQKPKVKGKSPKKPTKSEEASRPNDIYAELQSVPKKKSLKPSKPLSQQQDAVYEEAPMVPPKEDEVELVDNNLYESSGQATNPVQSAGNVDMVVNDLYDTAGNVDMVVNDLYDTTNRY